MADDDQLYERAALGALLRNEQALDEVRHWLRPEDFTWPIHRAVYEQAQGLRLRDDPVDEVTVLAALRRDQYPDPEQRLSTYVLGMAEDAPVPLSATYYCKIVLERSVRRELEAAGIRLQQVAIEGRGLPDDLFAQADAIVAKLDEARQRWTVADAPAQARRDAGVRIVGGEMYAYDTPGP